MILSVWLLIFSPVFASYYCARKDLTFKRPVAILQWMKKLCIVSKSNTCNIYKAAHGKQDIYYKHIHVYNKSETYITKKHTQQSQSSFYKVLYSLIGHLLSAYLNNESTKKYIIFKYLSLPDKNACNVRKIFGGRRWRRGGKLILYF